MNFTGYLHFILYTLISIISLSYLKEFSLISSIIFGWTLYGYGSLGHDCLHNAFTSNKKLDKMLAYFFIDCCTLSFSSNSWKFYHNKIHHVDINTEKDIMKLEGKGFFYDMFIIFFHNIIYSKKLIDHIYNIPLYFLFYSINWFNIPIIIFSLNFCLAYFTYITHLYVQKVDENESNWINKQLANSVDVFPDSWFFCFFTGGINSHALHHVYPNLNRHDILYQKELRDKLKLNKYYKEISTYTELFKLIFRAFRGK